MRHRPLLLIADVLLFGLPGSATLGVPALNAQGTQFGVRQTVIAATNPAGPQPGLVHVPDSARRYPPTYWKSGLLIGGILGGALGLALGTAFCGLAESSRDCTGAALGGALMLGTSAGAVGALVGGLFPREPKQPAPEHSR
jgi:hypothetical protein